MKKYSFLLTLFMLITFMLWLLSKENISDISLMPIRAITQITALIGAVGYFIEYILSSKLKFFEKDNLPLDKALKLHRIVGTLAGSSLLFHVATLITNSLPSSTALSLYLLPGSMFNYNMGIFAFYLLILMLVTTFYVKMPYNIWKFIHKISGYSIVFATLHLLLISSDISNYLPLRIWMLTIAFASLAAWIYSQFIYPFTSFKHYYQIIGLQRLKDITLITFSPTKNPIEIVPGQFAFFKFYSNSKAITKEAHPFTILKNEGGNITIAIKALGDYSFRIQQLKVGENVRIAGPHGKFGAEMINSTKPIIAFTGGIGVTPFINILSSLKELKKSVDLSLYYTEKSKEDSFNDMFVALQEQTPFEYYFHNSTTQGRISPATIISSLKLPPQDYNYFLCGPKGLLTSIISYLRKIGISNSQIFTEDFDFKDFEI